MAETQFTERQVLAILRKAAEYQAAGTPAAVEGMTEDQIRSMAVDLGISSEAIEMALRTDGEPAESSLIDRAIGGPVGSEIDRTFEGEVSADIWAEYVQSLRKNFGASGTIATVGNAYEWTTGDRELMGVSFSAIAKGGRTRLRATVDNWGALFLGGLVFGVLYIFVALGLLGWSGTTFPIRLLLFAALTVFVALMFRRAFGGMMQRRRDSLMRAVDEFRAMLKPAVEEPAPIIRERVRKGRRDAPVQENTERITE